MKQLWVPVWFESNLILQKYYGYHHEYFRSLNGIFNTTISYRGDSWINNRFYAANRTNADKEIYYKKTISPVIGDEEWNAYANKVLQKNK